MKEIRAHKFNNYKQFLLNLIESYPKRGRGLFLKIASYLNVHSTLISQVLRGSKDFTLEQAFKVAEFFALNRLDTDYFLTLVQLEKAGSHDLKGY